MSSCTGLGKVSIVILKEIGVEFLAGMFVSRSPEPKKWFKMSFYILQAYACSCRVDRGLAHELLDRFRLTGRKGST